MPDYIAYSHTIGSSVLKSQINHQSRMNWFGSIFIQLQTVYCVHSFLAKTACYTIHLLPSRNIFKNGLKFCSQNFTSLYAYQFVCWKVIVLHVLLMVEYCLLLQTRCQWQNTASVANQMSMVEYCLSRKPDVNGGILPLVTNQMSMVEYCLSRKPDVNGGILPLVANQMSMVEYCLLSQTRCQW